MAWTQQANDTFTGGGSTALESHTPDSGSAWDVVRNGITVTVGVANGDSSGTIANIAVNTTTLENKQAAECLVSDRNGKPAVLVRAGFSGGNMVGYGFMVTSFSRVLFRFDNSGFTTTDLDSEASGVSNGDTIRIEADGNSITCYVNGTPDLTATDATYSSGQSGIAMDVGNALDDFVAEDEAAGAAFLSRLALLGAG